MNSHQLANELLSLPDRNVVASVDINVGGNFDDKAFGYSCIEVIPNESYGEVILQFESGKYFHSCDTTGNLSFVAGDISALGED